MSVRSSAGVLLAAGMLLVGCGQGADRGAYEQWAALNESGNVSSQAATSQPAAASAPSEVPAVTGSQLGDYLSYAALHSPELESAFAEWKAALERVGQVRSLPDPRFTYRNYIVAVETRVGPQRNAYEVAQTFPWPGKLMLRGDVASREAEAAFYRLEAARLKLSYRVRKAYDEYYYLRRSIDVTRENVDLLGQIESVARSRYAVGAANNPDVIRAQVEQGKLADRLTSLQELRRPAAARLNAAMNRPASTPLPWPGEIAQPSADVTNEQLLEWASHANPEVRAMDSLIAARKRGIDLAEQEYIPDFTVGVNVIDTGAARGPMHVTDSGKDPVIAMVSVNLPIWWDRISAGAREARWRHLRALADKASLLNDLSANVEMAIFEFQDAGRKVKLYRDTLLPKAGQAMRAAQTGYSAGQVGFQDYLDAQRILLEFQLSFERSRTDRAERLAELEMLVGKTLAPASADAKADTEQQDRPG
jgi:outer membrane protein TolC